MRTILLALAFLLAAAAPASAASAVGWDGANPFACTVQQAGYGTEVPDPGADPYCVEFDKRRQNVTELGVVDFLSKEPARVAAATPRCFYFQSDHWRGSVVQEDGATKTYEWDGHYFFDKARGEGGAWVTNFSVNGRTGNPASVPGMPPEWAQYFGPGTGGVRFVNEGDVDPACAERAKREPEKVYATAARPAGTRPGFATSESCRPVDGGRVTSRSLGPVALGEREDRVRAKLGSPAEIRRGFLRWCAGGAFLVGQRGDRSGDLGGDGAEPTVMVIARAGRFAVRGVRLGARVRRSGRLLRSGSRRLPVTRAGRVGRTPVLTVRGTSIAVGVRGGRLRWIAVADRAVVRSPAGLRTYLRRALTG